jgi:hypothetical protein
MYTLEIGNNQECQIVRRVNSEVTSELPWRAVRYGSQGRAHTRSPQNDLSDRRIVP